MIKRLQSLLVLSFCLFTSCYSKTVEPKTCLSLESSFWILATAYQTKATQDLSKVVDEKQSIELRLEHSIAYE